MENYTEEFIEEEFRKVASGEIQYVSNQILGANSILNFAQPETNINCETTVESLQTSAATLFANSIEHGLKANIIFDDFRRHSDFRQDIGHQEWRNKIAGFVNGFEYLGRPKDIRTRIIMVNDPNDPRSTEIKTTPDYDQKYRTLNFDTGKVSGHTLDSYYQLQNSIPKMLINTEYFLYVTDEIKYTVYALLTEDILSKQDEKTIIPMDLYDGLKTNKNVFPTLRFSGISGDEIKSNDLTFLNEFSSIVLEVGKYRFSLPKIYPKIDFEKYKFESFFANNVATFQNLDKMTKYYLQSCFTKKEIEAFIKYIENTKMDQLTLNVFVNNAIYLKNVVKNRMQINLEFTEKQFARIELVCDLLKAFQAFDPNAKRLCDNEFFAVEGKKQFYIDKIEELKKQRTISSVCSEQLLERMVNNNLRRGKDYGNGRTGNLTTDDVANAFEFFEGIDPYTGEKLEEDIVIDCIVPMTAGGNVDSWNCIPVSSKINGVTEKSAKNLIDWWTKSEYWDDDAPKRLEKLFVYIISSLEKVTTEKITKEYLEAKQRTIDLLEEMYECLKKYLGHGEKLLEYKSRINNVKEAFFIEKIVLDDKIERIKRNSGLENDLIMTEMDKSNLSGEKLIQTFVEMINKNQDALSGLVNIKTAVFWQTNKEKILKKLNELKDNPEYEVARQLVDKYETAYDIDKQISIFIEMLNEGNSEILRQRNQERLKGYPNIRLSQFWQTNKEKILKKLNELKDNPEYEIARRLVESFEVEVSVDKQISIFIEMLNNGNVNVLRSFNQETLEGYPNIRLSNFWSRHKDKIKNQLFEELKDNPEYEVARQLIDKYETAYDIDKQISIFIEMLNEGNSEVLRQYNNETLKNYPNIKLSHFWTLHKKKIKEKLFIELKDNPEYETARQTINSYEELKNLEKRKNILREVRETKSEIEEAIISIDDHKKGKGSKS